MNENEELSERLRMKNHPVEKRNYTDVVRPVKQIIEDNKLGGDYAQWTSADGVNFFPAPKPVATLPPGAYEIRMSQMRGLFFERVPIKTEGILKLAERNVDAVVDEIRQFWRLRDVFLQHHLTYKRGIILWGPPGSGKTCAIQLCSKHLIEDFGGIVIRFSDPDLLIEGMRALRRIEPDQRVIVVMEDLDVILSRTDESRILQLLDGGEEISGVVFLATTNYPERLGARIMSRPKRFDKRFRIGFPNAESRRMYLEHLDIDHAIDVETWVQDTEGFSMAHLSELFVAVCILGDDYSAALETISSMKEAVRPETEWESRPVGFLSGLKR